MVKGLEKILKTTRNILLAGALGLGSLFIYDNPQYQTASYNQYNKPVESKPKLYTQIHSRYPKEEREGIEYIFENLVPKILDYNFDIIHHELENIKKHSKICDKIKEKYKEIDLKDNKFPINIENFCRISDENFNEFKRYGYFLQGNRNHISYGKLDSEEELIDDSWKEFGKEPTKRKVVTYYSLQEIRTNIVGFSHEAPRYKFKGGEIIYIDEDEVDNIIYIDMSNIEKLINDFIMDEIEDVKYYDDNCNHIKSYLSDFKDNIDLDLDHIILLEFDKIVNFDDLSSHIENCRDKSVKKIIGEMKNNLKDPNFKENLTKKYKISVFTHEANHPQNPIVYIENGILKSLNNFVENPDDIIVFKMTPAFNEFIAYFSEIANAPSHPTVRNFRKILLNPNEILKTTPHGKALIALAILYNKKLYTKFNIKLEFNKFIFDYLMNFYGANEIKNLSKEIYKDIFLSCPTPKEALVLLDINNKETCLISEYESNIER